MISNILQVMHIMLLPLLDCQLFSFSFYFYPLLHIQLVDEFQCPISPMYNAWTVNKVHTYYALNILLTKPKNLIHTVQLTSKLTLACGEHVCINSSIFVMTRIKTCMWHEMVYTRVKFRVLHANYFSWSACE